jgi:hypothetical protein
MWALDAGDVKEWTACTEETAMRAKWEVHKHP